MSYISKNNFETQQIYTIFKKINRQKLIHMSREFSVYLMQSIISF